MRIVFVQTSDAKAYYGMLQETARTVRAYCDRHGCDYEAFVGIRRGWKPWHAAFNRIYLLQDLAARGVHDWAVYMDADAYVADLGFDLAAYLEAHAQAAAILVRSGVTEHWWDVNSGVVLLNLRHPTALRLLEHWRAAYEAIPDATLQAETAWGNPNDQQMLHAFLSGHEDLRGDIHLASPELLNAPGARFIRQTLRSLLPDPAARERAVAQRVAEILADGAPAVLDPHDVRGFIAQAYRATLRREVDAWGLAHFEPLFAHLGFEAATRLMIGQMLESEEHRAASAASGRSPQGPLTRRWLRLRGRRVL